MTDTPAVSAFALRAPAGEVLHMPAVAVGTGTQWFRRPEHDADEAARAARVAGLQQLLLEALEAGCRHVDAAEMYLNEADVGPALQRWLAGGHSRAELWVTSKVDKANVEAGAIEAAARASIAKLGVEYLDLYLIHSPFSSRALQPETWSAMESLDKGLVRTIGVSNFGVTHLRALLALAPRIRPAVNQVELHPYLPQTALRALCEAEGIRLSAYAPLAHFAGGPVDAVAARVAAEAGGADAAQALLAWCLAQGVAVVTTSKSAARVRDALRAPALAARLGSEAVAAISEAGAAASPQRRYWRGDHSVAEGGTAE